MADPSSSKPSKPFSLRGNTLSRLQMLLIVMPSFVIYGYNQAGLGGLITLPDWVDTFPQIDTVNNPSSEKSTLQGFVVAIFVIGAMLGSLSTSYTGDRFGRRLPVLASALVSLVGQVLECSASHLAQLSVGRFICGLAVGTLSSIVPVWQSECADAHNRGRQVVATGLFMSLGFTLQSWINYGFFQIPGGAGPVTWRVPIAIVCFFSLLLAGSVYLFPESPRWLLMKGRRDEALEAICTLKGLDGGGGGPESEEARARTNRIEISLEETASSGGRSGLKFTDMFKMGEDKLLYRFLLCIALQFYQQMSGGNLISTYAPILFEDNMGLSVELSRLLSAGALTWKFASSFIAFFCVDRFGRRILFMISGGGMACCMVGLAVSTSFPDNQGAQIAACFFIYLFNAFIPIGFLGVNFLYCTEAAPIRLRMAMNSISTFNHWLWNFVVVMVTPVAIKTIGWKYYLVFACIAASVVPVVYFFFPETMGRNLEDIDLLFRESPSTWETVRFAKNHDGAAAIMFQQVSYDGKKNEKHAEYAEDD